MILSMTDCKASITARFFSASFNVVVLDTDATGVVVLGTLLVVDPGVIGNLGVVDIEAIGSLVEVIGEALGSLVGKVEVVFIRT